MPELQYQPRRLFTIEEANAMLPLVRAITSDLSSLSRELTDRQDQLIALRSQRQPPQDDMYSSELAQVEADLANDVERIKEYLQELFDLGVEPKGAVEGLVDFPALLDGRLVFLCWRLGETEVTHWHDIGAGFAGRQPLVAGSVSGADPASAEADYLEE